MSNYVSLKITQLVPEILFNIIRNKRNIPSNKVNLLINAKPKPLYLQTSNLSSILLL